MLIDELKGQKTTYCTQIEEISPLVLGETAHEIKLIHICKSTAYKIMARRRVTSFIDARQTRFSKYSITQTPKDTKVDFQELVNLMPRIDPNLLETLASVLIYA